MLRHVPISTPSHLARRNVLPNRPSFEFCIERTHQNGEMFLIEGRVTHGAMMPGSSGLLGLHGELHGLVVKSVVLGLHQQAMKGVVTFQVQRPAFDLDQVVPGTVFASEAQALAA